MTGTLYGKKGFRRGSGKVPKRFRKGEEVQKGS
jgi:hypothetical protein